MKKLRKILSVMLVIAMIICTVCISASATGNQYNITNYVAFGDSIGAGMNDTVESPRVYTGEVDDNGQKIFKRYFGSTDISYITKVANALRLSEKDGSYKSWAYCAFRASEIRMLVDPDYTYDDGYMDMMTCGPEISEIKSQTPAVIEDLKQADLITINVGSNDIFVEPLAFASNAISGQNDDETVNAALDALVEKLTNAEDDSNSDLTAAMALLETLGLVNTFVASFARYVAEGYIHYMQNFEPMISKIREYNPNAQIVLAGVYNPLRNIAGSSASAIGQIFDAFVAPINMYTQMFSEKYNLTFVDMNGTEVDGSNHPSEAGYQFMADRILENLSVMPMFKDIDSCTEEEQEAVEWAYNNGVTAGTSKTTFSPENTTTRAQIITFLWKAAGSPTPTSTNNPFKDVKDNAYYKNAVLWAVEKGITAGTSANEFSPNSKCTKAHIITFMYKYAGAPSVNLKACMYSDVTDNDYYKTPVLWAVENGIAYPESLFMFGAATECTRINAVTYLYRLMN